MRRGWQPSGYGSQIYPLFDKENLVSRGDAYYSSSGDESISDNAEAALQWTITNQPRNGRVSIETGVYNVLLAEGISPKVAADMAKRVAQELCLSKRQKRNLPIAGNPREGGDPEQEKLRLPDTAPLLYSQRPKGQGIIDFLRDPNGWGPYVRAGVLTRPEFRRLDSAGEMALRNWLRSHTLPDDIKIPTKEEVYDQLLASGGLISVEVAGRVGNMIAARRRRRAAKPDHA